MHATMKDVAKRGAKSRFGTVLALGLTAVSLAGCVVYPSNGYYGGGYGYAYAAPPPVYYAPPVAFDFDFGRGGWGGRHWH
jgi:hypothetical protein